MPVRITIDIFSGRHNPVITLPGIDAQEALARMPGLAIRPLEESISPPFPRLGYRGIVVQQIGDSPTPSLPLLFRVAAPELEEHILGPGGLAEQHRVEVETLEFIRREVGRPPGDARHAAGLAEFTSFLRTAVTAHTVTGCELAPIFEPDWWNDGGQRQANNNCYNYSTNYRSDTFAQPGRASGFTLTDLSCRTVKSLAIEDGLIDLPQAGNDCPQEGALIALVVAPAFDFHWYRKGRNGLWTHKPGFTMVTNLDNSGAIISDPRLANRGPYVDFCGFMLVRHGHIKLQ
jgi:hypothetical protein